MADENEWQFLGSDDNSGGADDNLSVTFTSKKFIQYLLHIDVSVNTVNAKVTFNGNTNSVYARRRSDDGGSDGTQVSQTEIRIENGIDSGENAFSVGDIVNISGEEKLVIDHFVRSKSGAANAPSRDETVYKFVPSPDADITQMDVDNGNTGDYDTKTSLDIAGAD